MKWFVYVLENPNGMLYIGMTKDIVERIKRHNTRKHTFTAGKGPWKLVYSRSCGTRIEARANEKYLKGGAGRTFLKMELARMAKLADAHA
ncbi:MAG: GIY-YIG nuclease family protein [bacterium]